MHTESTNLEPNNNEENSLFIKLFPYEILLKILDMLEFRALVACTQVCYHLRNIIHEASSLQYTIELGANGLENGPSSCSLNHADRLQRLLDYEKAWGDLKWTSDTVIPMTNGGIWELSGGVLAQSTVGRESLVFTQLPSKFRGIKQRQWTLDISQYNVRDFTMDPSQDLLVLVQRPNDSFIPYGAHRLRSEHTVQLLKLSDGTLHPAAAKPTLLTSVPMSALGVNLVIRPCGQWIAVLFKHPGQRRCALRVWNWKTGRAQFALVGVGLRSFGFLDERRIIVATHVHLATKALQPNLVVYDITQSQSQTSAAAVDAIPTLEESPYFCAFLLPLPGDWTVRLDIEIQSDPAPGFIPDAKLGVPFYAQGGGRMNVVTVVLTNGIEMQSFAFMIPSTTLLKRIAALPSLASTDDQSQKANLNTNIPWDEWGPKGTRMIFEPQHSNTWVCHVYGLRYTTPDDVNMNDDEGIHGATSISVYDFNPLPIRRDARTVKSSMQMYITDSTTIDTDGVFEEPVTTSLPYRLSKMSTSLNEGEGMGDGKDVNEEDFEFGRFGSVMCSEDSLLVVGSGAGHRQFRVLSF